MATKDGLLEAMHKNKFVVVKRYLPIFGYYLEAIYKMEVKDDDYVLTDEEILNSKGALNNIASLGLFKK
jgi:hypothetical protein